MIKKTMLKLTLVISALVAMPLAADGGDSSDWGGGSRLKPIQQLIDSPDDADLLNLMAFSHRKLEHFDLALDYYQKALQLKPKHRGANEYLGELYLSLGQLEKAQQRLEVLDKACFFGCKEFDKLEQAIEEYRRNNPS